MRATPPIRDCQPPKRSRHSHSPNSQCRHATEQHVYCGRMSRITSLREVRRCHRSKTVNPRSVDGPPNVIIEQPGSNEKARKRGLVLVEWCRFLHIGDISFRIRTRTWVSRNFSFSLRFADASCVGSKSAELPATWLRYVAIG